MTIQIRAFLYLVVLCEQQACYRYGVIREKTTTQDTVICSGHGRESRIYTSLSNSVEIQLVSPEVFSRIGHFLLHYEGTFYT